MRRRLSAELRGVAATLEVRSPAKTDDFLLAVDDQADRTPTAVWVAGLLGAATVSAVVWWILRS